MANHNTSNSSFAPTPSNNRILLPALSSARRSSNSHSQIYRQLQQPTYQASSSSVPQPPLRASSAMPHVSVSTTGRPQVRRRSNSISANTIIEGRPVAPTTITASASPQMSSISRLPVGGPDMATATISPRIRRLAGTNSSRGATSVTSSNSSSGGDEYHRTRRSRRLSLDLGSMDRRVGFINNNSVTLNNSPVAESRRSSNSTVTQEPHIQNQAQIQARTLLQSTAVNTSSRASYPPVPAIAPAVAAPAEEMKPKNKENEMPKAKEPETSTGVPPANGVPPTVVEMLTELEKELTCSICQSFYLNPVTLDCLHTYCGSCAKEWFEPPPPTSLSSASPTERGCPTCRQPVKSIKPSAHLNSLTTIYLRHNPHLQRSQQEIAELTKIYSPGDEITLERDRSHPRRDRSDTGRRAGDGWWDGLIEEREREDEEAFQAAVRASMRDLYENSQSSRRRSGYQNTLTSHASLSSRSSHHTTHVSLGLADRMDREVVVSSLTPATRSSTTYLSSRPPVRELQVNCDSCGKRSIHSSVHFHCKLCYNDDFDLCLSCVRRGDRCRAGPSQVHELEPRKYNPVTNELEKGFFCDNEFCSENINNMFWHCRICNDGKWDYCTACVNRGDCCSHDLEAMSCEPNIVAKSGVAITESGPSRAEEPSRTADDVTTPLRIARPLKLSTRCDLCHEHISSREEYLHCPTCNGGDWDCHRACLQTISPTASSSRIKCSQGHSLQVIIQLPFPDYQNPTTYLRRIAAPAERPLAQRSYTYKASHGATVTLEPENGKSQKAQATWPYWPETSRGDAGDELGFPKNAVIEDVLIVNREWYWGSYSGRQGLFPGIYVSLNTDNERRT